MTLTTFGPESTKYNILVEKMTILLKDVYPFETSSLYIGKRKQLAEEILKIVHDNDAIVAGGALTNILMLNPVPINDIDIYVHVSKAQRLLNSFLCNNDIKQTYYTKPHTTPVYDKSFMLRNNILGRVTFKHTAKSIIEVMIVKDNFPLTDVVENFDLTFCKAWTDGKNIYTHYYNDIQYLMGELNEDYLKYYLEGNTFTAKRLVKYKKRGFTIKYPNIDTTTIKFRKYKKNVISGEEWVVYFILNNLISFVSYAMNDYDFCISFEAYALDILTKNNNDKVYNLEGLKEIIKNIYIQDFNLNHIIYGLIMYNKYNRYPFVFEEWNDKDILKSFENIGIKILTDSDGPSHGFNNEVWDFSIQNPNLQNELRKIDTINLSYMFEEKYPDLTIFRLILNSYPLNDGDEVEEDVEYHVEDHVDENVDENVEEDDVITYGVIIQDNNEEIFQNLDDVIDYSVNSINEDQTIDNIILKFGNGIVINDLEHIYLSIIYHSSIINESTRNTLINIVQEFINVYYNTDSILFHTNSLGSKVGQIEITLTPSNIVLKINFYIN